MSDSGAAHPDPGPSPSKSNLPPRIAAAVAVLGAITALVGALNKDPLFKFVDDRMNHKTLAQQEAQKRFDDAYGNVWTMLKATPAPAPNMIRESVGMAYGYAPSPDSKCKVVNIIINYSDQTVSVQLVPVEFSRDVEQGKLPSTCADDLRRLATLYKSKGTYVPTGGAALTDAQATKMNLAAEKVIAGGTTAGTEGWIYVGRSDGSGNLPDAATRMIKEPRAEGRVTTTRDLTLHGAVPGAADDQENAVLGRVLSGSVLDVLEVKSTAEVVRQGSPPASYTWARVKIVSQGATTSMRARRALVRAPAITKARIARCAPFPETNSMHGPAQRWVYVGEKVNGDDAFVTGTSLLDTPCVPRDGMAARVLQQTRVYVGADPHYPGVRPTGQSLAAGTTVQVVGDVAGYPFDAAADPTFCKRDPPPRRVDPPISAGNKRFCVYIPFMPI